MRSRQLPRIGGHLVAASALVAIVIVGWSVLLGWDQHKHRNSAGTLSGPYEPWQVIVLVVVLVAAVAVVAWLGYWLSAFTVPAAATLCFAIAGINDPNGDGLWPVGAVIVLVVSGLATGLLAAGIAGKLSGR